MLHATIYVNPVGPAPIGFAQAAGLASDFRFSFKTQGNLAYPGIAEMYPQLVIRPHTQTHLLAYDIDINDPTGGSGVATVPGGVINDRASIEVYSRNALGQPTQLLASGRLDINGYSYTTSGPLGPASYPQGPQGPAGPAGAPGQPGVDGAVGMRGSRWYTGSGAPVTIPDDRVPGDMYLDESNGDVWRWDGAAWTAFRGV